MSDISQPAPSEGAGKPQPGPIDPSTLPPDPKLDGTSGAGPALSPDPKVLKEKLSRALEAGLGGAELIDLLKEHPRLAFLYDQDARVAENYTIEEHTQMVLRQHDRYLAQARLPDGITREELRLVLALHDIGKPIPANKEDQHRATIEVIEALRECLPIGDRAWEIGKALIDNDIVGSIVRACTSKLASMDERKAIGAKARSGAVTYEDLSKFAWLVKVEEMHDRHPRKPAFDAKLEEAAQWVSSASRALGMSGTELLKLVTAFYQADTSSYTYDAQARSGRRASPGLEFLFKLNEGWKAGGEGSLLQIDGRNNRLYFSYYVEKAIAALEQRVSFEDQRKGPDDGKALLARLAPERIDELRNRVSEAESALMSFKADLERQVEEFRAKLLAEKAAETGARESALGEANRAKKRAIRDGLRDLAKAAYAGLLGSGKLVLLDGYDTTRSRFDCGPSVAEKILLPEGRAIARLVPLTMERDLVGQLSRTGAFELTKWGISNFNGYHSLITPFPAQIRESMPADDWTQASWRRPSVALVELGTPSEAEYRDLFRRANNDSKRPSYAEWKSLIGEETLNKLIEPGDVLDLTNEGVLDWVRLQAMKLPSGRFAVMVPYVKAEWENHDEYGAYKSRDYGFHVPGTIGSLGGGLRPQLRVGNGRCEIANESIAPLTEEERAFVAIPREWRYRNDGAITFGYPHDQELSYPSPPKPKSR